MEKLTTYKFKVRRGIDDLKSLYAFHGSSQGDHSQTNSIKAYIESDGWLNFRFDCPLTEECIKAEIERRKRLNEEYIASLHKSGEFGKEVEHSITLQHNPKLDTIKEVSYPLESYSFLILDI